MADSVKNTLSWGIDPVERTYHDQASGAARSGVPAKRQWTAILLAGQRPGVDPLADAFQETAKAVIPVCGVPMVERVARTLLDVPEIRHVLLMAQDPHALLTRIGAPEIKHRLLPVESGSGIAESISRIAGGAYAPWPVLITTADHPLLTVEMVAAFLKEGNDADLTIGAVRRETVLARYPSSQRTWLRFRDAAYSGANLFSLRSARTAAALSLWTRAEQDRKQAFRLFWHFGPLLALRSITRTIGFGEAISRAGRNLGLTAALVPLDFAEAAIDVDKLADHRLVESILTARSGNTRNVGRNTPIQLSIFDLDRTLTRYGTYTPFLLHAAWRRAPWRLLLLPIIAFGMILHKCGLLGRRELKQFQHAMLLGSAVPRADADRLARSFADRLADRGLLPEGVRRIAEERNNGRRIILATAANSYYAGAIAARLGIADIVSTGSRWRNDVLSSEIDGENCYGIAKYKMVKRFLNERQLERSRLHIRFFSDHISDRATLDWADEAIAVNPSRKLLKLARKNGWAILHWSSRKSRGA